MGDGTRSTTANGGDGHREVRARGAWRVLRGLLCLLLLLYLVDPQLDRGRFQIGLVGQSEAVLHRTYEPLVSIDRGSGRRVLIYREGESVVYGFLLHRGSVVQAMSLRRVPDQREAHRLWEHEIEVLRQGRFTLLEDTGWRAELSDGELRIAVTWQWNGEMRGYLVRTEVALDEAPPP